MVLNACVANTGRLALKPAVRALAMLLLATRTDVVAASMPDKAV
jgi:hypothetical protein